ncbi:PqqD family protein [Hippea jasoniae]|uniref:PqqD family protein n=1 Tax=Hippea jasoniae TaxID=944479 RepID=UPI0005502D92|nr:PqqD family protein [Hippea jasoniae]
MKNIKSLAISEDGFIFDPQTGNSYTVNKTGLFIIKLLKENKSEDEIVEILTNEYDIDKNEAQKDVADFIGYLKTLGLMEN